MECSWENAEKAGIQWQSYLNDVWKEPIDVKVVEHFCSCVLWNAPHNTALFLWLFLNQGYVIVTDLSCPLCATHTLSLSAFLCYKLYINLKFCILRWTICITFKILQNFLQTKTLFISYQNTALYCMKWVADKSCKVFHTQIVCWLFAVETLFKNVSSAVPHFFKAPFGWIILWPKTASKKVLANFFPTFSTPVGHQLIPTQQLDLPIIC